MLAVVLSLGLITGMGGNLPMKKAQKPALQRAVPNAARVPCFGKFELTLSLPTDYANPFDPEEIDVSATFISPQGRRKRVPGFLFRPYSRKLVGSNEQIEPTGQSVWKIRFAPDVTGTWRYTVTAKDKNGSAKLPEATFRAVASKNPGTVQRSKRNPFVFAFPGEKPFFPVGLNVCWGNDRGSYNYEDWLSALSKAGGNWIRIWMCSWNCALEWTKGNTDNRSVGDYAGVGVYSLDNAWKLDTILDIAEKNGIYVMLCFGTYGEFNDGGFFGEGQWKANPYNVANGGPCATPADFWTNMEARKLYRRRLRYLMARYSYRTSIHAWEFWNEATAPAPWVAEMARCLKGKGEFAKDGPADPFGHLVSTTYGNPDVWKTPEIDFTMTHHYGTGDYPDVSPIVANDARAHASFRKPHILAEFGLDWRKPDTEYDPQGKGVNLHNALWASVTSGHGGSAMLWWWDNYVHPKNVYAPFVGVRRFVDRVPWTTGKWTPLKVDAPQLVQGRAERADLTLLTNSGWGKSAQTEFVITPGGVEGNHVLPQFLYSPGKPELRTKPTLRVRFAQPGRLILRVHEVSDRAKIRFLLDGQVAREVVLSAAPPADASVPPEYMSTEFKREYGIYQAVFDKDYAIEVPEGEHAITLENTEGDWVNLESLTLTGYRSTLYPQMNVYGLVSGRQAILWVQNAQHNWKNVAANTNIPAIPKTRTMVHGLPNGAYTLVWWDTAKGKVLKREAAVCSKRTLPLSLPPLKTDIALHIQPDG
jgi:hypothetical protein